MTYVVCKECGKKLQTRRPGSHVSVEGNVRVGSGVSLGGSGIEIRPGEGLQIGPGGSVNIGVPPKLHLTCPHCSKGFDYSEEEIFD